MNTLCYTCVYDCNQYTEDEKCENYKQAKSIADYNRTIKHENRNLHKFVQMNGLKYSELMKMLRYKTRFKYKYRILLENFLYAKKDEWKDFNFDEVNNG